MTDEEDDFKITMSLYPVMIFAKQQDFYRSPQNVVWLRGPGESTWVTKEVYSFNYLNTYIAQGMVRVID